MQPSEGADACDPAIPTGTNILLVGFMGTGKSSVGREVARLLDCEFVDTDERIVERAGRSVPEIFEADGEEGFREIETAVLGDLASAFRQVVSTGGGIVLREVNRRLLKQLGYVVWLTASVDEIYERVSRSTHRPLMQCDDPRGRIECMLAGRNELYDEVADLCIDSTDLTISDVAYGVVESARVHFAKEQ